MSDVYTLTDDRHVRYSKTGRTLTIDLSGFTQPKADLLVGMMNLAYIQGLWDQAHDEIERQKDLYL